MLNKHFSYPQLGKGTGSENVNNLCSEKDFVPFSNRLVHAAHATLEDPSNSHTLKVKKPYLFPDFKLCTLAVPSTVQNYHFKGYERPYLRFKGELPKRPTLPSVFPVDHMIKYTDRGGNTIYVLELPKTYPKSLYCPILAKVSRPPETKYMARLSRQLSNKRCLQKLLHRR